MKRKISEIDKNSYFKKSDNSPSLVSATFPLVSKAIRSNIMLLIILSIVSILLGFMPILKSQLESAVISDVSVQMHEKNSIRSAFESHLPRFSNMHTDGIPEKLAKLIFMNLSMIEALIVYIFIGILAYLLEVNSAKAISGIGKAIFKELRSEGLKRGLESELPTSDSFTNAPGQYANAIQQGVVNAQNTYEYIFNFCRQFVSIITVVFLLWTISIWFAISSILLVLGQIVISIVQARKLHQKRTELDAKRNDLVARTDDILSKREIIVVHEQKDKYIDKLKYYTEQYSEIGRKLDIAESVFKNLSQLLTDYGRIGVLVISLIIAIISDNTNISNVGDAYFIVSIYIRLFVPISSILNRYDAIKRADATSSTYLALLQQAELSVTSNDSKSIPSSPPSCPSISFEKVCFHYTSSQERVILTNCSFSIPSGSVTLILGPSGCGKTTAMRLLLKFIKPTSGRILVNGMDINNIDRHLLHQMASYVSQCDYIVDDTVRDNLSWAKTMPNDDILMQALTKLKISDKINDSKILDTPAKKLSIGQQQRLSISRLFIDDSPLIILDEPLSGVDGFTLRDILPIIADAFKLKYRTTIMISHRISLIKYASHVIVMNSDGAIIEEGAPEILLSNEASNLSQLHRAAVDELGFATSNIKNP